jgi:hypothetical protein
MATCYYQSQKPFLFREGRNDNKEAITQMLSLFFGMNNKYFFLKKLIQNMTIVVIQTVGVFPDSPGSFFLSR